MSRSPPLKPPEPATEPAPGTVSGAIAVAQWNQGVRSLGVVVITKTVAAHPHRAVFEWFIAHHAAGEPHSNELCQRAFDHALLNRGRLMRGVRLLSEAHAASLAGAAIWRRWNPAPHKGGAGRGQGRKAKDGQTAFKRLNVNVRDDQCEPFKELGGSCWLRSAIDREVAERSTPQDAPQPRPGEGEGD